MILIVGIGFVALLTGAIAQRFFGPELGEVERELEQEVASAEEIAQRELRSSANSSARSRSRSNGCSRNAPGLAFLGLQRRDLLLELLRHRRVAQRRHVAELAALGDVAQQPAHDLPRARLRQVAGPDHPFRPGQFADPLGDVLVELADHLLVAVEVALRVTNAQIAWPVCSSLWPITAASATFGWETIADSTSAVESRWPETLITSSIRPSTQR